MSIEIIDDDGSGMRPCPDCDGRGCAACHNTGEDWGDRRMFGGERPDPPSERFHVAVLNGYDRVQVTKQAVTLPLAMTIMRRLKRRGRTPWIETEGGAFHPVKGCMRDWPTRPTK